MKKDRTKGKANAKTQGGGTLERFTGVKARNRNENAFARANGLHESAETAVSCRGSRPARKYTRSRGEEDGDAHMYPCGKAVE